MFNTTLVYNVFNAMFNTTLVYNVFNAMFNTTLVFKTQLNGRACNVN